MKKTILLSGILAVCAAQAGELNVESRNMVGALDVNVTTVQPQTLIAVPFSGYAADSAVKVKDMVKSANLAAGSKIYVPTGDGMYNTWALSSEGEWQLAKVVTIDKNGQPQEGTDDAADTNLSRGDSFWIEPIFKDSATNGKIYLLGEGEVEHGTSVIKSGWNLIGNASVVAKTVNHVGEVNDQIVVQDGSLVKYYTYSASKGWCKSQAGKKVATEISIAPGQGLWYYSMSSGDQNFAW